VSRASWPRAPGKRSKLLWYLDAPRRAPAAV
jgi:hypothetical protein